MFEFQCLCGVSVCCEEKLVNYSLFEEILHERTN